MYFAYPKFQNWLNKGIIRNRKYKYIKYGMKSTQKIVRDILNTNGRYILEGTYVQEYNFKKYFAPFMQCFVQGYNLRGDHNKLCIFLLARGLIYLLKLIFFLSLYSS